MASVQLEDAEAVVFPNVLPNERIALDKYMASSTRC